MAIGQIISKTPSFNEVLILEKSGPLVLKKEDNSYVLEGICAVFGQRNNNNRVYEEKDYLPHLESLKDKINKKMLLGELDHPEAFEVSYKNVSHIIESLTYNSDSRNISIKLRLLDTPMGKIAKTLVEAGIPIAVSSRAAGQVTNEGKVTLHKIFTYDLVCEPGFSDAILKPTLNESLNTNYNFIFESLQSIKKNSITSKLKNLSESLNFGDNFEIFEIPAGNSDINNKNEEKITSTNMPEVKENEVVTRSQMNGYSEVVRKEFDSIKLQVAEALNGLADVKTKLTTPVVENVQTDNSKTEISKVIEYMDHLTENMNNIIKFNNYLATELNKTVNHTNHVAEATNNNINFSNYIVKNLNNSIHYSELVAKKTNEAIKFGNYLANAINEGTSYTEYVGKLLEKNINFGNYVATELNEAIEFGNYLSEQVNFGIKYTEHIAENLNNTTFSKAPEVPTRKLESLVEKVQESVQTVNKVTEVGSDYYVKLNEKIEKALSEINSNEPKSIIESKKYPFLSLLSESNKEVFYKYDYKAKEQIIEALNKGIYFNEKDVMSIIENTIKTVENTTPSFIKHMPTEYKPVWESLNETQRSVIYNQASVREVRTPYQVKNFWDTRLDLKGLVNKFKEESATTKVTESVNNNPSQGKEEKINESFATKHYSKDYLERIQGMINKNK